MTGIALRAGTSLTGRLRRDNIPIGRFSIDPRQLSQQSCISLIYTTSKKAITDFPSLKASPAMRTVLLEICAGNTNPSNDELTESQQRWLQRLVWRSQAAIDIQFPDFTGAVDDNETLKADLERACAEVDAGNDADELYQTIEHCVDSLVDAGLSVV